MAVHIRLSRYGMKKQPHFRIVVADKCKPRDGRFIEIIGTYDPRKKDENISIKKDRFEYWTKNGARPTEGLGQLLRELKIS